MGPCHLNTKLYTHCHQCQLQVARFQEDSQQTATAESARLDGGQAVSYSSAAQTLTPGGLVIFLCGAFVSRRSAAVSVAGSRRMVRKAFNTLVSLTAEDLP